MNNGNGAVKTIKLIAASVGCFVAVAIAIYTTVYAPLQKANAVESVARQERDIVLDDKIDDSILRQERMITEIKSDIKYLVKKVDSE